MCYQPCLLINILLQETSIAANIMALQTNAVKIYQNWLFWHGNLVVKLTILSKMFQRFVKKII